jgi:hypothetical protein
MNKLGREFQEIVLHSTNDFITCCEMVFSQLEKSWIVVDDKGRLSPPCGSTCS